MALTTASGPLAHGQTATAPATQPTTQLQEALDSATTAPSARRHEYSMMSLDELLDVEVSLVSRRPQRVGAVASAVQVITGEEIRRSGALTLPEALRLAPNLQVAQLNAHDWAITARGFNAAALPNNALSNKLLVMIDGRTVYTPLFGGVFWDVQQVLLEDVDRIEVVSGPGGTLWGANAVNGVINVVTRSARETQGLYLTGVVGTFWQEYGAFRYGGQLDQNTYYRVYGLGFEHDNTERDGMPINDEWGLAHGGFRIDHYPTRDDTFTLQGDIYDSRNGETDRTNPPGGGPDDSTAAGGNVLGRWTRVLSEESEFILQMYYDGTWRDLPTEDFGYAVQTFDVDFQHRFPLGTRQSILWGAGYRVQYNDQNNDPNLSLLPDDRTLDLVNVFAQDEIELVPERLTLTVGTKLEHNDYSGFEVQPSARLAWTPGERHTVWGAVSRAVRSPTRFDADVLTPVITSPQNFDSEKLTAYELGYRVRPLDRLSLSVATFYNRYDDLRSISVNADPPPPFAFENDQEAEAWGVELSGDLQVTDWWRLRGGFTYLETNIWADNDAVTGGADTFEANDPQNQVLVQSIMDLPARFQFDVVARYVDSLPDPSIPSYISMDVRVAWHHRNLELAVVGQNLLDDEHPEFGTQEIPRSLHGQISWRW